MILLCAKAFWNDDETRIIVHFGTLAAFPSAHVSNDNVARMGESIDMALIRAEEKRTGKDLSSLYRTAEQVFCERPDLGYNRRP